MKELRALLAAFLFVFLTHVECEQITMRFKPPNQTDEEMHSTFIPDSLRCDACQAISFQVYNRIEKFNKNHKNYKRNLPESELIDLFEGVCYSGVYESYGLKEVGGENRLNGPGVRGLVKQAGMIAGGGRWPHRLQEICQRMVAELGEIDIYKMYLKDPSDPDNFYEQLCLGNTSMTGSCVLREKKMKEKQQKEKEDDAENVKDEF